MHPASGGIEVFNCLLVLCAWSHRGESCSYYLNWLFTISGSLHLKAATHIFGAPSANQNPFGGQSLQYTGGTDPNNKNYSKLSQKLNEADIERRKIQEEAERRERAAEIRREERLAKIQYMHDMPDTQPAGTGE